MNQITTVKIDKANFLDWVERQEGRYELVRGRVIEMTGGTLGHSGLAANVIALLKLGIDRRSWLVLTGDLAIDTEPGTYRFPDVAVVAVPFDRKVRSTVAPVLLVEVSSPSSLGTDFDEKANEYLALASLQAYVIVSQDTMDVAVWLRRTGSDGCGGFDAEPVRHTQAEDVLAIPAIGFACTVGEIYDGIL